MKDVMLNPIFRTININNLNNLGHEKDRNNGQAIIISNAFIPKAFGAIENN